MSPTSYYDSYHLLFCKILPPFGKILLLHQTEFCFSVGDKGETGLEGQAGFKGKPGEVKEILDKTLQPV